MAASRIVQILQFAREYTIDCSSSRPLTYWLYCSFSRIDLPEYAGISANSIRGFKYFPNIKLNGMQLTATIWSDELILGELRMFWKFVAM